MSSESNEEVLVSLKRQREKLDAEYHRTMADIRHRKEQYDARMTELVELGCDDLDQAVELEKKLQDQIQAKVDEIRALL